VEGSDAEVLCTAIIDVANPYAVTFTVELAAYKCHAAPSASATFIVEDYEGLSISFTTPKNLARLPHHTLASGTRVAICPYEHDLYSSKSVIVSSRQCRQEDLLRSSYSEDFRPFGLCQGPQTHARENVERSDDP